MGNWLGMVVSLLLFVVVVVSRWFVLTCHLIKERNRLFCDLVLCSICLLLALNSWERVPESVRVCPVADMPISHQ